MSGTRMVPACFLYETPRHYYVLRKWLDDPVDGWSTASQVVMISENFPLQRHELRERLEALEIGEPSEFVLIDVSPGSSCVLDTFERGIEGIALRDMALCRCYAQWWDADACIEMPDDGDGA